MPAPAKPTSASVFARTALFIALVLIGITFVVPFVWQVLISLSTRTEVDLLTRLGFPPSLQPENYARVFTGGGVEDGGQLAQRVDFARYFFNSFFVAGWVTLLQVITSAMAAYAFSRVRWPGRDKVFLLYLGTMMIPGVVLMVPNFVIILGLGMFDNYTGLVIPAAFSAFGTFLLRQFMLTIPSSLDEAASIDGAGHWRIFTEVILPLARPGLIVLAIFTFLGNYNSFFWPLIITQSPNMRTLPIGLMAFDSSYGRETPLIMAASLMAMIPPIILFLFLQKYLVKGIQLGAVKG
ncbi:MAG: carbohydrate ABC transporter permease [Phycisphaeraceae bacterium]|nr:MAG: carbohydrate ABC transporter permease [Phycisphaeraceae bacterium]